MSANTDITTEETTSLDKTINELDNSTKFGATGGYVPFQKNNANGRVALDLIADAPMPCSPSSTPFSVFKRAYDYGTAVLVGSTDGKYSMRYTPVAWRKSTKNGTNVEYVLFSICNPSSASSLEVCSDGTYAYYDRMLDDTQVLVLSLKTALWTGDVEYTYNMYENAAAGYDSEYGRLVDFGEIPAGVTSITIKFSHYVCSGMYQFKVPENSSLESVSVVLDDDDETPLMVAKDSVPESYEAGHVYQISVLYKNVVFGDFESATADTTDTLDNTDNVTDGTDTTDAGEGAEGEGGVV